LRQQLADKERALLKGEAAAASLHGEVAALKTQVAGLAEATKARDDAQVRGYI
jgi:hypothetical protein